MAHMMRSRSWIQLSSTYGFDRKGSARARDKRMARREIDSSWDEIQEEQHVRETWTLFYNLYPAEYADQILDRYGIPRPPSRERRTL